MVWLRVSVESFAVRHSLDAVGADAMECFPVLAISLVDSALLGEMRSS